MSPMKPRTRKALGWGVGLLALVFFLGLLLPCSHCPQAGARRVEAHTLIQQFDVASRAYKAEYGVYPSGKPADIVAILVGKNLRSIAFFELPNRYFDQTGQLIDFWGTPFRFEHVSDAEPTRLTSAGPDKTFGTPDDITLDHL